jgi:two-component system sensor histidine kinase KdpD
MLFFNQIKNNKYQQYALSISLVLICSILSYFFVEYIGYRVVALILLLIVSILAMLFDILSVLITALLSAVIWNFFFIPPTFTFHISNTEDTLMFLMYFVVASINAVLTYKIRQFEKKYRDKEEKEKTIKLYNTLLNSLSHELRTPISMIIGAVDTINDNKSNLTESHINELHSEIKISGYRLNKQVENLLNMSRLESDIIKPNLDWFDLNELITQIIEESKEDSQNHFIQFVPIENFPLIKTDRIFIEQIINNLIYNALNHTPNNTVITIELEFINNICKIYISDNGKGFPEKEIKNVFNKFYRLSNTKTGGIGLGLSICKGFTEALNGQIKLENLKSGGAKFTIEMPVETYYSPTLNNE